MFEKFTDDARQAVVAAQKEARDLRAPRIESVHLFLGVLAHADPALATVLREEGYTAESVRCALAQNTALGDRDAQALESIGIDLDAVRASLDATFGDGAFDDVAVEDGRGWFSRRTGHIPFASGSKKALELSLREALAHGDSQIRTHHLLLGLIRGGDGRFVGVVADPNGLREKVEALHANT